MRENLLKAGIMLGVALLVGAGLYMTMEPAGSESDAGETPTEVEISDTPPEEADDPGVVLPGEDPTTPDGRPIENLPPPVTPERPKPEISPMIDLTTRDPDYSQELAAGQLWRQTGKTLYATANVDICLDRDAGMTVTALNWDSSNTGVVRGFRRARTYLGFSDTLCLSPDIAGVGTTTVTAVSADGSFSDSIVVNIVNPDVAAWEMEIVRLVNNERKKVGLETLWVGTSCAAAAATRAREIAVLYEHTRPGGGNYRSLCPSPPDVAWAGGENIHRGASAVSPATVVADWMKSADHRANILNPNYLFISVGFYFDINTPSRTHWAQIFTTW
jgi:uncharacterized protein YkwD